MSRRALYLDDSPGERRGVVVLEGSPERILFERYDDRPCQQPGAVLVARVRRIERTLNTAFLDLGEGPDGVLALNLGAKSISEGARLEIEIVSAARGEKGPVARLIRQDDGAMRGLRPAPSLEVQLQSFAPGVQITGGPSARDAADASEDMGLLITHPLPSGGRIHIEPTHALTAIDVDLASAAGDARKAAARANKEAIEAAARLLRLKGLGGLVAVDLAGKGHDGGALAALAKAVFAPEGPGVSIGPISRFGVLELALPRKVAPLAERLLDADGRPSAQTVALRLLRAIERAAGPGRIVDAACAPEVAEIVDQLSTQLVARIGARFHVRPDVSRDRTSTEVTAR